MPSWVQINGELIPKEEVTPDMRKGGGDPFAGAPLVYGDPIQEFRSPIDGSVIQGKVRLNEHMKRHGVTGTSDFKNHWKEKAKERGKFFTGQDPKHRKEIRQELIRSLQRHDGS